MLAADDGDEGFEEAIGELAEVLGGRTREVSISEGGVTAAREELFEALSEGSWYCVYLGHGSTGQWAAERLLVRSDAGRLAPAAAGLPRAVSVELTCLTGNFEAAGETLAEAMLRAPEGGFSGTVASSGMTEQAGQLVFARELLARLGRGETLGESLLGAKHAAWRHHPHVAKTFNLLGDPAGR